MASNPDQPKARFRVRRITHADETALAAELNGAAADGYQPSHGVGLPIVVLPNGDLLVVSEGSPEAAEAAS